MCNHWYIYNHFMFEWRMQYSLCYTHYILFSLLHSNSIHTLQLALGTCFTLIRIMTSVCLYTPIVCNDSNHCSSTCMTTMLAHWPKAIYIYYTVLCKAGMTTKVSKVEWMQKDKVNWKHSSYAFYFVYLTTYFFVYSVYICKKQ